jgi:hypothetical protein
LKEDLVQKQGIVRRAQCTALNDAQQHCRTATEEKWEIFLRTLHHNAHLSQKEHLYSRHEEARQSPRDIADLHVDGMTRAHSMFPCVGQDYTFPKPLGHKVEGLINYNGRQHILHTFQNIRSGTNIAMHLVLLELELMYKHNDLPPTIY